MKRKFRLVLAMVLAMMMVIGMSISAMAGNYYPPQVKECTCSDYDGLLYYVTTVEEIRGEMKARLVSYNNDGSLKSIGGAGTAPASYFGTEGPKVGPIYHLVSGQFVVCEGNGTYTEPDPKPDEHSNPVHVHSFQWQTITEPTKDADGLEGEMCSCGATRNTQPLSAYGYALNEYATPMINAAKSGQTITFEFGEWNSFPKSFMAKLVDKSAQNVTFVFHYKWNHVKQEIKIPAGTPIDLNFDWYGPAKMAELYGAN